MGTNQIMIIGVLGGHDTLVINLGQGQNVFGEMTVQQMKMKIIETIEAKYGTGIANGPDDLRLLFAGKEVKSKHSNGHEFVLSDYSMQNNSTLHAVFTVDGGTDLKQFDPEKHFGLKFTLKPDAITGEGEDDEDDSGDDDDDKSDKSTKETRPLRALLSCGHAVSADSLTQWCRSLLDQGKFQFYCPAVVEKEENKLCKKEWEYAEVRKVALLNEEEMRYFERQISKYAASQFCEFKECPGCRTYLERRDTKNLRVNCPMCTKTKKCTYDFCWTCEKEWQGSKYMSVSTCGRSDCVHPEYPAIRDAPMVTLPGVNLNGKQVPNRRACPTCGKVVEHSLTGCKFMDCTLCHVKFCFVCLSTEADCLANKRGSWFGECAKSVAPRQTSIPVWSRR